MKCSLKASLERLDRAEEQRADADLLGVNYEATLCRVAQDATSILSSVSQDAGSQLSLDIDKVVSTIASRSTFETAPLIPFGDSRYRQSHVTPDLEYTGSFFRLSVHFHGTPDHVKRMKSHFAHKALALSTTNLSNLSKAILQELTHRKSAGARMDFYFYDDVVGPSKMREFLAEQMNFTLPDGYETGDVATLFPRWLFWLHSMPDAYTMPDDYSMPDDRPISDDHPMPDDHLMPADYPDPDPKLPLSLFESCSNKWRMTFMRRLDDLETLDAAGTQIVTTSRFREAADTKKTDFASHRSVVDQLKKQLGAQIFEVDPVRHPYVSDRR